MIILIIGCGKDGSGLANSLYKAGHDVAVVDADKSKFQRLDDAFTGFVVEGIPIDLEVLQRAGIEGCDFVAAVTEDDNTNVMVSQLAKEFFHVPKVLTRIYDPKRNDVFAQFGLHTISPTALTVDIIERIINGRTESDMRQFVIGENILSLDSIKIPKSYIGTPLSEVEHDDAEMIIGIKSAGGAMFLRDTAPDYKLRAGDELIFKPTPSIEYPDAIGVFNSKGQQLGNVSAELAEELKYKYPTNPMRVYVDNITGGEVKNYGCNIRLTIFEI